MHAWRKILRIAPIYIELMQTLDSVPGRLSSDLLTLVHTSDLHTAATLPNHDLMSTVVCLLLILEQVCMRTCCRPLPWFRVASRDEGGKAQQPWSQHEAVCSPGG